MKYANLCTEHCTELIWVQDIHRDRTTELVKGFFPVLCIFHVGFSSSSMTHFEISWKLKHLSWIGTLFSHSKCTKQKISL